MPKTRAISAEEAGDGNAETHLAINLRRLRLASDLTLDQLAHASGVSRAMISKIERGASVPTATVLGKLAGALKVGLSQLLVSVSPREPRLIRLSEQSVFRDPETGFERRSLSPLFADGAVDVAINHLPAGRAARFPAHHAGVEEHLIVQTGTLIVSIGEDRYEVGPGDAVFYPADRAHAFINETEEPAAFYVVVYDRRKT